MTMGAGNDPIDQASPLPQFRSLVTNFYTVPLRPMRTRATPYEYDQYGANGAGAASRGDSTKDHIDYPVEGIDFQSDGQTYPTARLDIILVSARTTGRGWEAQFVVRGNKYLKKDFKAGQGLAVWCDQFVDAQDLSVNTGTAGKTCIFSQQVAIFFIKEDGGVTESVTPDGENVLHITASTPDDGLSRNSIAVLPFLSRTEATTERGWWGGHSRTADDLTFAPEGFGGLDVDPLAGYGRYVDKFTEIVDPETPPPPANELHIIQGLTLTKALKEYWGNHVFCDRGNGFTPIGNVFPVHIDDEALEPESDLLEFEIGPGSPEDACEEMLRHGNWLHYWSSMSEMYFTLDYSSRIGGAPGAKLFVTEGRSYIGTVEVTTGPEYVRVGRAAVESQWSMGADGQKDPMTYHASTLDNMGVYPAGRHPGQGGDDVTLEGYLGRQVARMAAAAYAKASQRTTLTIEDFPFVGVAFGLFNQVIGVSRKSPFGLYDWSPDAQTVITAGGSNAWGGDLPSTKPTYGRDGKKFKAQNIVIEAQNLDKPGGVYYTASISGTEIIPLP